MAMIDTFRRLAKLGFYFGLGVVTAAFDACGDGSTPGPDGQDAPAETRDEAATGDDAAADEATTAEDAAADEAAVEDVEEDEATAADGDADVGADADGDDSGEDLWDVVFE
jgi:hypothetical protein